MKILVLNAGDLNSLGWSYKRAFDALGHETTIIDPVEHLTKRWLWNSRISRRVLERQLIELFNRRWLEDLLEIDVDLVWVGKGAWATSKLWESYKAKRPRTKLVCYNPDDPINSYSRGGNRPWISESIPFFDLFCTYKPAIVPKLAEAGARAVTRIPFAWDAWVHPHTVADKYIYDVVFVGNGDGDREEWLKQIFSTREAKSWRAAIFGYWPGKIDQSVRKLIVPRQIVGVEMAALIAKSKISINILRRQNEGAHNMRTFETPGAGGLSASQFSADQASIFPAGEAAIYFSDAKSAAEGIAEAVADDRLREGMRANASAIVAGHRYEDRARVLLEHAFAHDA